MPLTPSFIAFSLFCGIAPDLDLLVGWALGDINGYHHLGSHSLAAACVFGFLVLLVVQRFTQSWASARQWAISGALMYTVHLILDYLSADGSAPYGLQILWPFSEGFYISPVTIFLKFMHDTEGADMWGMISGMFVIHNLYAILLEAALLTPILAITLIHRKRSTIL